MIMISDSIYSKQSSEPMLEALFSSISVSVTKDDLIAVICAGNRTNLDSPALHPV